MNSSLALGRAYVRFCNHSTAGSSVYFHAPGRMVRGSANFALHGDNVLRAVIAGLNDRLAGKHPLPAGESEIIELDPRFAILVSGFAEKDNAIVDFILFNADGGRDRHFSLVGRHHVSRFTEWLGQCLAKGNQR